MCNPAISAAIGAHLEFRGEFAYLGILVYHNALPMINGLNPGSSNIPSN